MFKFIKIIKNKLNIRFNTYYIFENNNKYSSKIKIDKKFKFLVIDNIKKTKLINTKDYKSNLFLEEGIKKKCIAFCITHNNNFAHITWISNSNISKKFVDQCPMRINWHNTMVWGRAFTNPIYRNNGLYSFTQQQIQNYLAKNNFKYQKFSIKRNNIQSIKAMKKFKPKIVTISVYIRLYKFNFRINIPYFNNI